MNIKTKNSMYYEPFSPQRKELRNEYEELRPIIEQFCSWEQYLSDAEKSYQQMMNRELRRIDRLIGKEWKKECNNASDAHWRAQNLTRLQQQREEILKSAGKED